MIQQYTRTTQNFNNETREWENRQSSEEMWCISRQLDEDIKDLNIKWSFGVHAFCREDWSYLREIIDETISMFKGHAAPDHYKEFNELLKNNPNYREVIKSDILKELNLLIKYGFVKTRYNTIDNNAVYWNS